MLRTAGFILFSIAVGCGTTQIGSLRVSGGCETERQEIAAAVQAADAVYTNPKFWDLVRQRRWLRSPSEPHSMEGKDVADALMKVRPIDGDYRIAFFRYFHGNGQTGACTAVTLYKFSDARYAVNTIAHENTHRVAEKGEGPLRCIEPSGGGLFLDRGENESTRPWLVSYAIGDLAQCFSESNADEAKTWKCFDGIINGQSSCRPYRECAARPAGQNVSDIRDQSPRCAAIREKAEAEICPANMAAR